MPLAATLPIALLLAAGLYDLRWRLIPNALTAGLALSGLVFALPWHGTSVFWTILAAGGVLAGGTLLFAAGVMGGGDVKLAAAFALWLPAGAVPSFLVLTALAGGILGLAMLLGRAGTALAAGHGLRAAMAGGLAASTPYGTAIAAGGIAQLALGG